MSSLKSSLIGLCPAFLLTYGERIKTSPLGYRLAKGAFWSLAGALISRGLGLISAIIVGRMLGKQAYGELGIIQNTIGMFGTVAGLGMGATANKYVAEFKFSDPVRAGRIIALASATAWLSSGLMTVALVVFAPWLATHTLAAPHLAGLLQIGGLLLLSSGINGAQIGALSGFEAFKAVARINLICGLLTFPLMILGARYWGVTGAVWGLIGSQLANCILSNLALRKEQALLHISSGYAGCFSDLSLFWKFSLPAVLLGVLNSVVGWGASALVVNQLGGYGQMGIYNAAMRVKGIPDAILTMLIAPILPVLSESFGRSDQQAYKKTLRVFLVTSTLALVPVSLIQTAAPRLTLMPFGHDFDGQTIIISWLMLHSVLTSLGTCVGNVLVSVGRMWLVWVLSLSFAVCYAVLAITLVPHYGVAGYVASQALAYGISSAISMVVLYRNYAEMMRYIRWLKMAVLVLSLFGVCVLANLYLPFAWAFSFGVFAALIFTVRLIFSLRHSNPDN